MSVLEPSVLAHVLGGPLRVACLALAFAPALPVGSLAQEQANRLCSLRIQRLTSEKEELDRFLYNRIVRVTAHPDRAAACMLYWSWKAALQQFATELEDCSDFAAVGAVQEEEAEVWAGIYGLHCRQPSPARD